MTPIGPLTPDRAVRMLALNNANADALSPLDAAGLARLVGQAFWAARVGDVDGFILTFDQDADYASPNFRWFQSRYDRFIYVDRIVIAAHARGQGHARRLYDGALEAAGLQAVVAEVNCIPPNRPSDALHAALGFQEVGRAAIHSGAKTVRYLMRPAA